MSLMRMIKKRAAAVVQIFSGTYTSSGTATRTAGVRFNTSGVQESRNNLIYTNRGNWRLSGLSSAYDIMATHISGAALASGTLGTWENLATSREWTVVDATADLTDTQAVVEFAIRPAGGGATLATNQISLIAGRT